MRDKKIPKIVFLATPGRSTNIIFNSIKEDFEVAAVIFETPISKIRLLKGRIKKLGLLNVMGQVAFQMVITKILSFVSSERIKTILNEYRLSDREINSDLIVEVPSVNDEACFKIIMNLSPDLVIVNGTRIISAKMLNSIPAKFINMHAGITPKYRGVHGAYWALANNDPEHCGVTIHVVDAGIDTGTILSSAIIRPTKQDNFCTYPYLQLGEGLPLLKEAIRLFPDNLKSQKKNSLPSKLWYHPTVWQYLYGSLIKGVK